MLSGIVDLGSNTIRLSVYQWEGSQFQTVLHQTSTVGLAGYVQDERLSPAGIAAACQVLSRYRSLAERMNISDLHVFATASLRNISNTQEAADAILGRTGIAVEVLSGTEEARLSFRGAVLGSTQSSGLLCDIGGGSSELLAYDRGEVTAALSRPIGCLSLFTRYVSGILPTPAEREAMEAQAAQAFSRMQGFHGPHLLGVGGSVRAAEQLAGVLLDRAPSGAHVLTADQVQHLYRLLAQEDQRALRAVLHTVPDRVHTILPGLLILREILRLCGGETVTVSHTGIREGYLLDRVMKS